ncbi:glycosyltransferase 87 family protein [Naumannella halotolerans]|uniref:glycosyltransferase 87 family protein n=1 Tax=Naumannella halotolerans TaxID=993414 RepID=UPI00370DD938
MNPSPAPTRDAGLVDRWAGIAAGGFQILCAFGLWLIWSQWRDRENGDIPYYYGQLTRGVPIEQVMPEYPVPALWLLELPRLLIGSQGDQNDYRDVFVVLCFAALGGFSLLLWHRIAPQDRRAAAAGVICWAAFSTAMGTVILLRPDIAIAVLGGTAVLLGSSWPVLAGALLALAGWLKIWPVVLAAGFLPGRGLIVRVLLGGFGTAVAVAVVVLVSAGWQRMISPLTYQSDRGLQVESLWATPLLLGRLANPAAFPVRMTEWKAFEIFGEGRDAALVLANLGALGLTALVALACWRSRPRTAADGRRPGFDQAAIAELAVLIVLAVLLANKTFSPQYLSWLGPPLAIAVARAVQTQRADRALRWAAIGVAAAAATFVLYPFEYGGLVYGATPEDVATPIHWLLLRNALLVALFVDLTWCRLRTGQPALLRHRRR